MRTIQKETADFGMPWETEFGYTQAVKVGDTIYIAGQLGHDDKGNLVVPMPVPADSKMPMQSAMEVQMQQAYANAQKILARFGATLDNVVEEVLYVLDMESAFTVAGRVRKAAYGMEKPLVASTILVTPRLALPGQLIEIKFISKI
jgi:enamine deaminase RidA (YjgF/YER057c/UK114 family)